MIRTYLGGKAEGRRLLGGNHAGSFNTSRYHASPSAYIPAEHP